LIAIFVAMLSPHIKTKKWNNVEIFAFSGSQGKKNEKKVSFIFIFLVCSLSWECYSFTKL
jgi:hypothetical protein